MAYVDGYLLPVPKRNVAAYARMARVGAKVWMDHGALDYKECVLQDASTFCGMPFSKQLKLKKGETAVLAFVVFRSKKERDRVNAAVMKDPRIAASMGPGHKMPFDANRMVYSGFDVLVDGAPSAKRGRAKKG
ncbi:MAG: DUF1428 domain-containing protein [Planctomycetes bacterium]|nr:DUF1428 domain-containing protein [Planctomycetota bacterium]